MFQIHEKYESFRMASKQLLRKQVKELLKGLNQNELAHQSAVLATTTLSLIKDYKNIACFMSMDHSEVKTNSLIEQLFEQGKVVYLPRCSSTRSSSQVSIRSTDSGHHTHLVFYKMKNMDAVVALKPEGKYQLREPIRLEPEPLPPKGLEVILVPGVAFSLKNGARMGHGAGYYDDYISRHIHYTGRRPLLIGLALDQQIVDEVPIDPHDQTMDCIICGNGTVKWFK